MSLMPPAKFVRVRNWKRYQHYKERRPPWIKLHLELLENYELMECRASTRWLACGLLLLAARYENLIPCERNVIGKALNLNSQQVKVGLQDLLQIRFVERTGRLRGASAVQAKASAALALARADARSQEAEAETETDKGSNVVVLPAPAPGNGAAQKKKIDEHHLERLLGVLTDKDNGTEATLRKHGAGFPVAAFEHARERVLEDGVRSPSKLAVHLFTKDAEFRASYGMGAA